MNFYHKVPRILQASAAAMLLAACGGTVDTSKGTNDTTPATVNLLITRAGQPNLEVQQLVTPSPNVRGDYGSPIPKSKMEFSVLATATDAESGISSIKLLVTRTVCFRTSAGNVSQAYFGTKERKSATYQAGSAPTQASLGDTGIFDNTSFGTDPANLAETNLLLRRDPNNALVADFVGVSTRWNMETKNFAGQTTYSDRIFVTAGDTSCVTQP
jgi:hypothetical protein